jgi:hypothetical protein
MSCFGCSTSRKSDEDIFYTCIHNENKSSCYDQESSKERSIDYTTYKGFSIGDMITVRSFINEYNLSIIKLYTSYITFKEINTSRIYYITYDELDSEHKIFIYDEPTMNKHNNNFIIY